MSSLNNPGLVVLATAITLVVSGANAQNTSNEQFLSETRLYLDGLEQRGMACSFVFWEDGQYQIASGYGLADRETGMAWSPEVVSSIASITKQFTGAAILKLQEQGKLSVKDPISKYFTSVNEDKRDITLHHLLTHTSGIQDLSGVGDHSPIDRSEFIRRAMVEPLAFAPGSQHRYSNAGYSLLAAVMEIVTDESYESWLRREFFLPLGMADTGYLLPEFDPSRIAKGYENGQRWGTVLERPMADDGPYWVLRGCGGIHSTSRDMVRWGQALFDGEVLSASSMSQYWAPHSDESNGDGVSFYGYGWVTMTLPNGQRLIAHDGGNGFIGADMALLPDSRIIMFVASNVVAETNSAMYRILRQVRQRLLADVPYPAMSEVEPLTSEQLEDIVGSYESTEGLHIEIEGLRGGIIATAMNHASYSFLFPCENISTMDVDTLTRTLDAAQHAWFENGDASLIFGLYQLDESLESFTARRKERDDILSPRAGKFKSYEIVGTGRADLDKYPACTLVRVHYEQGTIDRFFLWDDLDTLRGYFQEEGMWPPRFWHLSNGSFESIDEATDRYPKPVTFQIREGRNGLSELVLPGGQVLHKIQKRK
ncbi:MAG: serine hydrolase [Planctomycetota bacterium]|nr:serine hydrolase [Planctomycetota bacterium]